MSEASRRGTFKERKAKAVVRNKEKAVAMLETLEKKDAELTTEERQKQTHYRIAMLSFMAMSKRSGMSIKELKRGLRRHNKKRV